MSFLVLWLVLLCAVVSPRVEGFSSSSWANSLPKFSSGLPRLAVLAATAGTNYTVWMSEADTQMLPPGYPVTRGWGYCGTSSLPSSQWVCAQPGLTIEATRNVPIRIRWINNITSPHIFSQAVDPTLHWANPNRATPVAPFTGPAYSYPVPLVPHVHGLELNSDSDGHPDAWWTHSGLRGAAFNSPGEPVPTDSDHAVFYYPNQQPPATLWYHDHTLGLARLNVVAGLSGFYILRDPSDPIASLLPSGLYDVPLLLQDRLFNETTGQLLFPNQGDNPAEHPFWRMQYLGDVICVNGRAWPNLDVDRGQYQFRLLNGANARFFNISFSVNSVGAPLLPFQVIGSDGGYLRAATTVTSLLLAPSDRFVILFDFSSYAAATQIVMHNSAAAPFVTGPAPDPLSTGLVMQFTVGAAAGFVPQTLPTVLNPALTTYPSLPAPVRNRTLTLIEQVNATTGLLQQMLLDGIKWHSPVTEYPELGSTEEWIIINLSGELHPIHLHLVQFQLVGERPLETLRYRNDWLAANGGTLPFSATRVIDPSSYWTGPMRAAAPVDQGWQDTVHANPEMAAIFRVRFAPIGGEASYPFNATKEPGFVWHCHILDHEDNEMMRPFKVVANASSIVVPTPPPLPSTTSSGSQQTTTSAPSPPRDCTTHNVTVGNTVYIPQLQDVFLGDSVQFTWVGTVRHNVQSSTSYYDCSPSGAFSSGPLMSAPASYTLQIIPENGFTSTLDQYYFYHCQLHCFAGMVGVFRMAGTCGNYSAVVTTTSTTAAVATTTTATSTTATTPAMGAVLLLSNAAGLVLVLMLLLGMV